MYSKLLNFTTLKETEKKKPGYFYISLSDNCKKTAVIVDTMIASMDVVNCQSCKVQVCQ